jgi:hypothetical protein
MGILSNNSPIVEGLLKRRNSVVEDIVNEGNIKEVYKHVNGVFVIESSEDGEVKLDKGVDSSFRKLSRFFWKACRGDSLFLCPISDQTDDEYSCFVYLPVMDEELGKSQIKVVMKKALKLFGNDEANIFNGSITIKKVKSKENGLLKFLVVLGKK